MFLLGALLRAEIGSGKHMCLVSQSCPPICDPVDCSPPGSSVHGDFSGKNAGVGFHALLQGIFPTQGLNPRSPALRADLYHLSHHGSQENLLSVCFHKVESELVTPRSCVLTMTDV